jgi:hypothetical protein
VEVIKFCKQNKKQRYKYIYCNAVFIYKKNWVENAYKDYALKQIDIETIAYKYGKNEIVIWCYFDNFEDKTELKSLADKYLNLVVDTTYFGRGFGYIIFRAYGVNLHYKQVQSETISWLACGLKRFRRVKLIEFIIKNP